MASPHIKGHLDVLILSVIGNRGLHGYAIISELKARSRDRFDIFEGTLYPALHRLEREGLLESSWAAGSTRRRRVYRLSTAGRGALAAEKAAWKDFVAGVESVIGWAT